MVCIGMDDGCNDILSSRVAADGRYAANENKDFKGSFVEEIFGIGVDVWIDNTVDSAVGMLNKLADGSRPVDENEFGNGSLFGGEVDIDDTLDLNPKLVTLQEL